MCYLFFINNTFTINFPSLLDVMLSFIATAPSRAASIICSPISCPPETTGSSFRPHPLQKSLLLKSPVTSAILTQRQSSLLGPHLTCPLISCFLLPDTLSRRLPDPSPALWPATFIPSPCLYSIPSDLLHFMGLDDPIPDDTTAHRPSPGCLRDLASTFSSSVASPRKGRPTLTASTTILLICNTTCFSPQPFPPHPFNRNSNPPGTQVKTREPSVTPRGKTCAHLTPCPQSLPPLHYLQ